MNSVRIVNRADSPLIPRIAAGAVIALGGLAAVDAFAGSLAGFTLFDLRWSEADNKLGIPALTEQVLRICFWHNLIWVPLRVAAAIAVYRGSRIARIGAIVVELVAVAVWVPTFFITVDARGISSALDQIAVVQFAAAVCVAGSIAAIGLLSTYGTRSWCDRP
ncbi:hypothetical protein [Glycomyces buryatensis]|uniref:Uncharacterized protein n=1 Tax=Glycomyces buryatensis TaxID=2570927 RepID=A0A4S8QPU1_9ACTN|nr:hypothetical protein [Glycomyces buryatensis]THV42734.1 hypothetical protein FAB82_04950 [Glycomyces buryatensis]